MNRSAKFTVTSIACLSLAFGVAYAQPPQPPQPPPLPPGTIADARLSEADAISALKAELEKLAASDEFSGSVVIAKDGKTIFEGAYGLSDREKKTPNTVDTIFRIGSMNKMFTATAVLQLVQAGKIKLDGTIGQYLPDYPNKDVAKVTIHQLLTHTGGTGDIFTPEYMQRRKELKELKDYVTLYGARGLRFEPGSKWEYSNYGFLLLGRIVEVVSGQSYYDYVRANIFKPAGMASTDSYPEDQTVTGRSIGYTKMGPGGPAAGPQPLHSNEDSLPYRGTSAGGGYSTTHDLVRFAEALRTHKLLNAEYTELLTTGKVDTPNPGMGKYAYGFSDAPGKDGARHFGHGGGAPGMNGDLEIYPNSHYEIAVLANLDPMAAQRISLYIASRLPAK